MKTILFFLLIGLASFQTYAQANDNCLLTEKMIDEKPALVVEFTNDKLIIELDSIFIKNGYIHKGFIWKNALWEVVNQKDFNMLRKIDKLEDQDDRFVVLFFDSETRTRFYQLVCPILNNPSDLDFILANRKKYE
jgi:hypothetical protein